MPLIFRLTFKINPVRLTLWLGVIASCFLPLLNFLPNRLFGSEPVFLFKEWSWSVTFLICLMVLLGCLSVVRAPRVALITITTTILSVCYIAGHQASLLMGEQNKMALASLATGFWVMFILLALMLLDGLQRIEKFNWRLGITAFVLFAISFMLYSGHWNNIAILTEYYKQAPRFNQELFNHFVLVGMTLLIVLIIGIPLGFLATKKPAFAQIIFSTLNTTQTLPSIALFAILIAPLSALAEHFPILKSWGVSGIGVAPALIALVLYTLLPITRNTYAAFNGVPESVKRSARAMGMTRWQLWRNISLPLALPVILSGVRIVLVQAVGLTVVAALIGAGGLGIFVWQGLGENVADLVLLGAIPTIVIALILDLIMQALITRSKTQGHTS